MHTSSLNLYQYEDGYRYNSDTLFLYDFIKSITCKGEILDVGAGCGILGLLIKRDFPQSNVKLVDIQKENVTLCKENATINSLHVKVEEGDFLEFDDGVRYDFIVSNPPFYHEGSKKSTNKHLAKSRYNANLPFTNFAKKCYKVLGHRGKFCFCYDAKQLPFVLSILVKEKFGVEKMRFVYSKNDKISSLVLIFAVKDSKSLCSILPPLFASEDKGHSLEAKEIFSTTNTMSKTWKS